MFRRFEPSLTEDHITLRELHSERLTEIRTKSGVFFFANNTTSKTQMFLFRFFLLQAMGLLCHVIR